MATAWPQHDRRCLRDRHRVPAGVLPQAWLNEKIHKVGSLYASGNELVKMRPHPTPAPEVCVCVLLA